ncbi:MAG TPA: GNVR domain-containing protein [Candidatus Limnocylindrales bacterium]|jgi:tyrosine-protein kinase Etk/Wzc|nr:GNVR domain-containing protein [Candidatus Limnocylindrales bacterium]
MESSRVSEAHTASGTGVYDRDVMSKLQPAVESPREVDAIAVLQVLANNKMRILKVTLAAALLALIVSLLLPKMYTATTTILPPQQNQSAATALVGQIGVLSGLSGADLGLKNPSDLFVALLKCRSVQDGIVNRFDLRRVYWVKQFQDARKKLNSRSDIMAGDEGLISISVSDRDPQRAAAMANAYVDQLRSLNQNLAVSEAAQRRLFYQEKLDAEREELAQSELALKEAQEKSGLIQPDAQSRAIIDAVAGIRAQVGIKEVQLQVMRTYATADNPDLKRAEQELAGLRGQLAQLERSTGALGNGNLEIPTRRLPEVELDYIRRARELKYHEALYEFLSKQLEAARIDEAKEAVVVQVVDKAVVPEKKSGPRRMLIVLVTTAAASFLSCLWVLLAEALRRKQRDPQERERMALLRQSFKFSLKNS